jgi:ribokinase
MKKILVVGSLHYDIMVDAHHRPEKGETVIGTGCSYKFGGKGGNQAISAAKSGVGVKFLGAVGSDDSGKFLLSTLQNNNVDTQFVNVIDGMASGMSVATMDAEGDYGAVVVSNANLHINPNQFDNDDFWNDVSMLLLQNEVPEVVNVSAAQAAKKRNITVCINAAPAKYLSAALQANIDVLVVNGVEARDMSGITVNDLLSASNAALKLNQTFPVVVVTAGEYGVAFSENNGICHSLPAEKVELVSTHGAGDCFMGMLCASMINGLTLAESVANANKAAAIHVSRKN